MAIQTDTQMFQEIGSMPLPSGGLFSFADKKGPSQPLPFKVYAGPPFAKGGEKKVYRGANLDGKPLAVAIYEGALCTDTKIAALRTTFHQKEEPCQYAMSEQYQREGNLYETTPLMLGQDTEYSHYTGCNGFTVLYEAPISREHPYPSPSKNAIRLILNLWLGLLHMYRDMDPEVIHADFKPEQLVVRSKTKPGIKAPYATLVLVDMPKKLQPKEYTPGYRSQQSIDSGKRSHSDDLFALMITLRQMLYHTCTQPLFKASSSAFSEVETCKSLAQILLQGNDTIEATDWEKIISIVDTIKDNETKKVALFLIECINITKTGVSSAFCFKDEPTLSRSIALGTLEKLTVMTHHHFLPDSGPTGSPSVSPATTDSDKSTCSPPLSEDSSRSESSSRSFSPIDELTHTQEKNDND